MQATCSTRCFTAAKATRAARRGAAQPVRAAADTPRLEKAKPGEMVDSLGYKLMRPGVKASPGGRQACCSLLTACWELCKRGGPAGASRK